MKDLKNLSVTQVRIFPHDFIPYEYLFRPDIIDSIIKKYQFQKKEFPFQPYDVNTPNVLHLQSGELTIEKKKILITSLIFEERKITLIVSASSEQAERVFSEIAKDIKKIDPSSSFNASRYLIKTEETSCVAKLNINYESLFLNKAMVFLKQCLSKKVLPFKLASIRPIKLTLLIDFQQDEELLQKHRITISPKNFIVEPRPGTSFDERIFYTQSPTDSETHLKILKEFEKAFLNP